ncbi:MAG: UbiA family prenyltransferase [Pseudomonadota bacterium]
MLHPTDDSKQADRRQDDGPQVRNRDTSVALVVDLDGTLCRSDTMLDAAADLLSRQPLTALRLAVTLRKGKQGFKRYLAQHAVFDPALLPYNQDVLDQIDQARSEGREVALVSASHQAQVDAVAAHLDLFDVAVGTGGGDAPTGRNLKGEDKARFLVERYGCAGFDYVGDSPADIPVWKQARQAFAVNPDSGLLGRARRNGVDLTSTGGGGVGQWSALIKAMRPHQWAKNLLIFLPLLAAQQLGGFPAAALAAVCFSLAASSAYLINDLVDIRPDRIHPRKRHRPFASGQVSILRGVGLAVCLLSGSLIAAFAFLPADLGYTLVGYVVLTLAYSFWLKRKMLVDVITLGALYTLRIIAGAAATGIVLSTWLLAFSMFLFFALATLKRQAELEDIKENGSEKTAGRNLQVVDLPILRSMSIAAGQIAVFVFALYVQDETIHQRYANPRVLLLVCPVLFFWLGRLQLLAARGHMTDDPIVFAFRDRISVLCGATILATVAAAAMGGF